MVIVDLSQSLLHGATNYPSDPDISINKENDKAFQDIIVEILADLHNYNYIFVIL